MLQPITDYNLFKETFKQKFYSILDEFPDFRNFLYEVFFEGTAYVIGGFLRDLANNKSPRDLDMILKISPNKICKLLSESQLNYKFNRMGGAKIYFENFQVDLWSIENNWGFRNNLIKMNEQYIVDNIASGCFYNFDSLVINVHKTLELSVRYYNECIEKKELNILRKGIDYKKLNPTIEANILKAFYIHEMFNIHFSEDCRNYLIRRLLYLKDNYGSILSQLTKVKKQYPKYDIVLSNDSLVRNINDLVNNNNISPLFN